MYYKKDRFRLNQYKTTITKFCKNYIYVEQVYILYTFCESLV